MDKFAKMFEKDSNLISCKLRTPKTLDEADEVDSKHNIDIDNVTPVTITGFFNVHSKRYALSPALAYKNSTRQDEQSQSSYSDWTIVSYADYADKVRHVARMLVHIGLKPNAVVGVLTYNCPERFYLQFGILQANGVVCGINPSNTPEAVFRVLDLAGATFCIVDDFTQLEKVRCVCDRLPKLKVILQLHGKHDNSIFGGKQYFSWDDVINQKFNNDVINELQKRECEQVATQCAIISFAASGAVSTQRTLRLTHASIIKNVKTVYSLKRDCCCRNGRIVSYLPLNHAAAQIFEIFVALLTGACVFFAGKDALRGTLVRTLRDVKPTMFLGVPRIYERLQRRMMTEQNRKGTLSKWIEKTARDAVNLNNLCESKWDTFADHVIDNTRKVIGMECCKLFFSGGAPLSENIRNFFSVFNATIIDFYGLPELETPTALNSPGIVPKRAEKLTDSTEMKIRRRTTDNKSNGEKITSKGHHGSVGRLNKTMGTATIIDKESQGRTDGLGSSDGAGLLRTSSSGNEFITVLGQRIAPLPLEEALKNEFPAVSNAVIVGDKREYISVLLTLKTERESLFGLPTDVLHADTRSWLEGLGLRFTHLSDMIKFLKNQKNCNCSLRIMQSIAEIIGRVNDRALSNVQRVQKFLLLPRDFSVPTGELGPSLNVRRNIVLEKYAKKIDEMYI